jgi:hypothetical protein
MFYRALPLVAILLCPPLAAQETGGGGAVEVNDYLSSGNRQLQKLAGFIANPGLEAYRRELKILRRRRAIDGRLREWKSTRWVSSDPAGDYIRLDETVADFRPGPRDDLVQWGCLLERAYLSCFVLPAAAPRKKKFYHYNINIINSLGNIEYSVVWRSNGNYINRHDGVSGEYLYSRPVPRGSFACRRGCEFLVPLRYLRQRPFRPFVQAVVWNTETNTADVSGWLPLSSVEDDLTNYPLRLLMEYEKLGALAADDPWPAAQAVVDSFAYRMADEATRKMIAADGVLMAAEARRLNVRATSAEEMLVWCDRGFMLSSDNWNWKLRNNFYESKGLLNVHTYRFFFLDPAKLSQARGWLDSRGLVQQTDPTLALAEIERQLTLARHYRASLDFLKVLYENSPADWEDTYQAAQEELENGQWMITEIGGDRVAKSWNWSANYQFDYLSQHGRYFGNCVDTTALSILCAKALGIPALHIHYAAFNESYYQDIHSFPAALFPETGKLVPFLAGGNQVFSFARPADGGFSVLYYLETPIAGHLWNGTAFYHAGGARWFASNHVVRQTDEAQWEIVNRDGVYAATALSGLLDSGKRLK